MPADRVLTEALCQYLGIDPLDERIDMRDDVRMKASLYEILRQDRPSWMPRQEETQVELAAWFGSLTPEEDALIGKLLKMYGNLGSRLLKRMVERKLGVRKPPPAPRAKWPQIP